MIHKYHKVFAIGHRTLTNLFKGTVEITEKVDGSQFGFGKINNNLYCRSRGVELVMEAPDKMFKPGVDYVKSIQDKMPGNTVFYGEFLQSPKHNVLAYDRIPKNHIALFGVHDLITDHWGSYICLIEWAEKLDIDVVPLIYEGELSDPADLLSMLDHISFLGGQNIEGVVVKNYNQDNMIGDIYIPFLAGKYVAEKFKERHNKNWKAYHTAKGKWDAFKESFCTEARWEKAIIHLKEVGELEGEPRDIGKLIRGVQQDILDEETDNIKDMLWKLHSKDIMKTAIKGLPEWYKEKLLEEAFKAEKDG